MKTPSYQYTDSNENDKTVYNGNPIPWKMVFSLRQCPAHDTEMLLAVSGQSSQNSLSSIIIAYHIIPAN